MGINLKDSETYKMSSNLKPGPQNNYVISSFTIALPKGVNIGLVHTETTGKVEKSDDILVDGVCIIFTYKAFEDEYASAQELSITHPKILGYPAQVEIIVVDIGGGGTSTVKDVIL